MSFKFALAWGFLLFFLYLLLALGILVPVENGWWENLEAVVLIMSVISYFVFCPFSVTSLIFAFLIFLGLGEETKWGIGWTFKDTFNMHQMDNVIVHALLLSYGILLPLLTYYFAKIQKIVDGSYLPSPPIAFIPICLLTLLFEPTGASEAREMILYLLFLGSVIFSVCRWREQTCFFQ